MLKEHDVRNLIDQKFQADSTRIAGIGKMIEDSGFSREEIFPGQARLFEVFLNLVRPQSTLEIGTFLGYSTAVFAEHATLHGGAVTTVELEAERSIAAKQNLERAEIAQCVEFIVGDDRQTCRDLRKQKRTFDLIFIDSYERNYPDVYDECLPMLADKGLILVDNVLMKTVDGWENGDNIIEDPESEVNSALHQLLDKVRSNQELQATLIPSGSGLLAITRKQVQR